MKRLRLGFFCICTMKLTVARKGHFLFRVVVVWDLVEFCVSSIICAYFSYDALDENSGDGQ